MAMPSYDVIRSNYLSGLWDDRMLKCSLVCKAITQEQYDALIAEKATETPTPIPKASRSTRSKK